MSPDTEIDFAALVGSTLADKYTLIDVLGAGAMGCVFRAEQIGLGRTVAVKLLRPDLIADHLELFRTEALAASRINHPHAIAIYDFGVSHDGVPFLVMERLRGASLVEVIGGRPMGVSRVVTIGAQVLSALAEAHACGVIHRDLKSDNIVLEPLRDGDDFAKLIDFGIARLAGGADHIEGIAGTPQCMAPEQIRGEEPTPATDLYAVGILLYEMIAGRPPFSGDDIMAVLRQQLNEQPVAPIELVPTCPPSLSALVMTALAKDASARPASARAMRDALLQVAHSAEARRSCGQCGGLVSPNQRFCGECGGPIDTASMRLQPLAMPTELLDDDDEQPTQHFLKLRSSRVTRMSIEMAAAGRDFVGRHDEVDRVRAFYRGDIDASTLALVGPVGVGKSRLIAHVAEQFGSDCATFVAAADPAGIAQPWFPVLTMLQSVLGLPPAPGPGEIAAAVARFRIGRREEPGLIELFCGTGAVAGLEPAVRQREVHAAAIRCLVAVHERYPRAVLCFTDVDGYDDPSRGLIAALVERLASRADLGCRVVVTAATVARVPAGIAQHIDLAPLSTEDNYALVQQLAPDDLTLPAPEVLYTVTHGVPEAVEQLIGWLRDGNSAASAAAHLVDLIAGRLAGLLPAARRVLQALAVHGTVARRRTVAATVGAFGRAHDDALIHLIEQRLVAADPEDLRLPSELLRDVIRSATPQDVWRELHRNALTALAGESVGTSVLAHHRAGARDGQAAIDACQAAGAAAMRQFDVRGAATWYARAVDIAWERHSMAEPGAHVALMGASIRLSDALREAGRFELSTDVLTQAALGEPDKSQRAFIARQRARLERSAGNDGVAVRHYRAAVKQAIAASDRGEFLCEAYLELADTLARSNAQAAIDELREAVQVVSFSEGFDTVIDNAWLWRLGLRLALRYRDAGDAVMAEHTAAEALAYAKRCGDVLGEARLVVVTADLAEDAGRLDAACRDRIRAIELLKRLGDRRALADVLSAHAPHTDRPESALRAARQLEAELG